MKELGSTRCENGSICVIGGGKAIMRYGPSYLPLTCDIPLHKLMQKWQILTRTEGGRQV